VERPVVETIGDRAKIHTELGRPTRHELLVEGAAGPTLLGTVSYSIRRHLATATRSAMKIRPLQDRVIVKRVKEEEKTKGGIIRPDSNVKEDVWQGMVGLVVKKGPIAFVDDDENRFGGANVEVGEWVAFTPGDGRRVQINGVDCRIIEDTQLMLKVADPAIITHYK
jgi:co-chaperonin GroES (HSP10)